MKYEKGNIKMSGFSSPYHWLQPRQNSQRLSDLPVLWSDHDLGLYLQVVKVKWTELNMPRLSLDPTWKRLGVLVTCNRLLAFSLSQI